jgi:LysR family transcriptional regulator, nitrogen assimilation regulatory protein
MRYDHVAQIRIAKSAYPKSMEIKQLKTFIDVAANGSYARTSAIVGVAQSALSRQMAALERGIGARLFHRTGRGVVLTELGERLLPRARALVADADAWQEAARGERAEPHGEVTLGVVPVASRGLVAALAGQLRNSFPGIRLRALEAYSGQVEEWLAAGRVEIAIYNRYRRGRVANAESLARTEVHLIARRDHPMARRRELAVRSFAEIPLAMPVRPNSLTSVLTGLAASRHFELDIRFEAGSTPLIKDVMLASDLATISPRDVFSREIASGELVAIPIVRPKIQQTTWMSVSSHHPPSGAAEIVARLIRQLAARQRGTR